MKILNVNNSELLTPNIDIKKSVKNNDFKSFLLESIEKLNSYENEANQMGIKLSTGEIDNIHEVMIASQKADIALELAIEVRDKIMNAYNEIMRMQV